MAFTTLEERFNQVSKQIYNRYAPSTDQYVSIKPNTKDEFDSSRRVRNVPIASGGFGSNSRVKDDSRGLPIVSAVRDIRRITKFWNSPEGKLFIGKQLLLQTGNTFAETRLYNPVNILLTAVPFVGRGITRHVGNPIGRLKTPTRELRGALQRETLNKFSTNTTQNGLLRVGAQLVNAVVSPLVAYFYKPKLTEYFGDPSKEYYIRPEDLKFYDRTIRLEWIPASGNIDGRYLDFSIYSDLGPKLFRVQPLSQRGNVKTNADAVTGFVQEFSKFGTKKVNSGVRGIKTFKELENTLNTNGYFSGKSLDVLNILPDTDNATIVSSSGVFVGKRFLPYPTVRDPYNEPPIAEGFGAELKVVMESASGSGTFVTPQTITRKTDRRNGVTTVANVTEGRTDNVSLTNNLLPISPIYSSIGVQPKDREAYTNTPKTDIIKFIFRTAEPNSTPIHFRAFLSELRENVKPEFSEQRYLGRTERFVTYGGAKRTASFNFNVVSFGASETDQVWARINYLTGLAFPRGYSDSGFMVPPLFRITIGGIYDDQPCYIETLDYDFLDDSITFDIDKEVSQAVNVKMSIVLLEKRSRYYDSPFYAITET